MSDARSRAEQTARIIVEHGAFYIRTAGDPFFFTSGWASPLFIDCKKLISFPDARNALIELSLDFIAGEIGLENIDSVAGCELAGVPFAAMIADRIERPLVIVRKQGKGFGRLAQFEGHFDPGSKVLLVDDLATDGISKLAFRAALERAEAEVTWTFVLFDYDVFRSDADLASLAKLHHVVDYMAKTNAIDPQALVDLQNFAANAPRWSKRHGGISALPEKLSVGL
jgi:orotate phosphoribosyltransferase